MTFHFHHLQFTKPDPEDNGLHDEILQEQLEPEAITLEESLNGEELTDAWQSITSDLEQDPDWFKFTEE
jgi:hypothetical protein